jgi:hypothetical protein
VSFPMNSMVDLSSSFFVNVETRPGNDRIPYWRMVL